MFAKDQALFFVATLIFRCAILTDPLPFCSNFTHKKYSEEINISSQRSQQKS